MQGMVLENLIGQVGILEAARGEYDSVYIIVINVVRLSRVRAK
jgi:hypothetical protein